MSSFDDYLNAAPAGAAPPSFDAYLSQPTTAAATAAPQAIAAPAVPAAAVASGSTPAGNWQTPSALGMGIGDAVMGGIQGIVHGVDWAANKVAPDSQFAKDFHEGAPQVDAEIQAHNAQYSADRSAAGKTGEDWGRLAGNVIGTAPSVLAAPEGLATTWGGRLAAGALQGGAGAAMLPATDPNASFADQKLSQIGTGAAFGAAIPGAYDAAVGAGRGLWNAARPVVQPARFVGQGLANAMDPAEAATAAANIRNAQQFVPGSLPTTAQAGQTPVLVQTEKAAGNIPAFKTDSTNRAIDNNTARWQALMGVAQTPDALQAAQTARATAVEPLYDAANTQTANVGRAFINFAQRPAVQTAMQQADLLAKNEGVQLKWPTPQDRSINGQALDYTQRALGDMIGSAQRSGNNQQARALTDAQDYLKSWTASYIPEVRQAAQTYAGMSVPINTMEAGQSIANSLGTRAMNAGGVPEIQLSPYRTALNQAMSNAKFGIDANAHGALQGIGQDLQRATVSNSIRSPGSDTAYNIGADGWLARQLYGPTFGGGSGLGKGLGAVGATLAGHPMAGLGVLAGGNKLGQMVGDRLQSRLSDLLLNPNSVLPYLDARSAASVQAAPNAFAQRLLQYGRPSLVNGLSSSQVNAP